MKKILDWANKFPKALPLILMVVYFIASLLLTIIETQIWGWGTIDILSLMTFFVMGFLSYILLFFVYITDKKAKSGKQINPYIKIILLVILLIFALPKIIAAIPYLFHLNNILSIVSLLLTLIYVFACLLSLLAVLSWETTAKIGK